MLTFYIFFNIFSLDYLFESHNHDVTLVVMHTRTRTIAENLAFDVKEVENIYNQDLSLNARALKNLEKLGLPNTAIEQIKFFEILSSDLGKTCTKEEWVAWLLRRTKKSLTAFMKKKIPLKIIFKNDNWNMYAEAYSKPILQLHKTCKPYFDEFSSKDIILMIDLTGNEILLKE
jgi:hypothetical protein